MENNQTQKTIKNVEKFQESMAYEFEAKQRAAVSRFESNLHWLKSRLENMERIAKDGDYDRLNSLGELQSLGAGMDASIAELRAVVDIKKLYDISINYSNTK